MRSSAAQRSEAGERVYVDGAYITRSRVPPALPAPTTDAEIMFDKVSRARARERNYISHAHA
jgi:hypothetical protein